MSKSSNSKLYICVREDFPDFMTPTLVAHAVLRHHIHWKELVIHRNIIYENYLQNSFKKCVVRVNAKEFAKIRALPKTHNLQCTESWENKTLNGEVSCVTVLVDEFIPNVLKFAKLWQPLTFEE